MRPADASTVGRALYELFPLFMPTAPSASNMCLSMVNLGGAGHAPTTEPETDTAGGRRCEEK